MNKKFLALFLTVTILTTAPVIMAKEEVKGDDLDTELASLEKEFETINNKNPHKPAKASWKNKLEIVSLFIQGTWQVCKERHFKDENKELSFYEKIQLSFYTAKEIGSQVEDLYFPDEIKAALDFTIKHLKNHKKKYISLIALFIITNTRLNKINLAFKDAFLAWLIMLIIEDFILLP